MKTMIFLLLLLATSLSFSQINTNYYDIEEQGFFVIIGNTDKGLLLTDNYASTIYLLENGSLEKVLSSAGCGRYVNIAPGGKSFGYKFIDKFGLQSPEIYNLETKTHVFIHGKSKLCGQVSFSDNLDLAFSVDNILKIGSVDALQSFEINEYVNIVKIHPQGKLVAYANDEGAIVVFDSETGKLTQISDNQQNYAYPQWSPDGNKLLYQAESIFVYDFETGETYNLGKGLAPKWSPDSKTIAFHKTEISEFEMLQSDIYLASYNNSFNKRLTFSDNVFEMNPVFISENEIVYHTYNRREIVLSTLNSDQNISGSQILFAKNGPLEIAFFDVSKYNHVQGKAAIILGPAPYVHQVYDTPDWHNGHGSCKPTSAVMAVAFYNRLPKWPTKTDNESAVHYNDYGSYVADKYRYDELFFEINEPAYGTDAFGAYGYMWGTGTPTGTMQEYLEHHGMVSNTVWTSSTSFHQTKTEVDLGYCHPICSWITSVGHVKLAIGYVEGLHSIVFNDPYGNKNTPGYPSNDGAGAIYDWPGYNNGYANLDNDGSHGYIAWSTRARSQEVEYNDTIIDDLYYNHGFHIQNQIDNLGGGYNIQQYYRDRNIGYNNHFWYTISVGSGDDVCYVTWTPTISEPGEYEVKAYIPSENATCTNALYKIYHAGGSDVVAINQNSYSDEWVSLGTYYFEAGTSGYAYLGDYSGTGSQMIAFDAVKWNKVNSPVNLSVTNVTCNGAADGSISATFPTATPPVSYLWSNGETTSSITGLSGGVYEVTATDFSGTYTSSTSVYEPEQLIVSESVTLPTIPSATDGEILLEAQGGTSPYSVIWTPSSSTNMEITGLSAGNYSYIVTDVNSCFVSNYVEVSDPSCIAPEGLVAGSITHNSVNLSWTSVAGVSGYAVKVFNDNWDVFNEYYTNTNSLDVYGLASGTDYHWMVASVCDPDSSVWTSADFSSSTTLSNIVSDDCTGVFTDPGGYEYMYGNSQDFTFTISPTGATSITVIFDEFSLEAGSGSTCDYDYLAIYDGPNSSSTLLGTYCNTTGSPGTIVSSGSSLHFVFHSDGSTVRPGWLARWFSDSNGCGLPETTVNDPDTEWQTDDFEADYSDTDNNHYGLDYRFWSPQELNGTKWESDNEAGFLFDDFDTSVSSEWVAGSGTWSVSGGALLQSDAAISNTNFYIPVNQTNDVSWLYEFDMKFVSGDATRRAGLHIFCDDPTMTERNNSYLVWFRVEDNTVELWDNINNVDYLRATGSLNLANGTSYNVKLLYNPDPYLGELTLFVDDMEIVSWTDHTPIESGNSISLRTRYATVEFDNVAVYQSRGGETEVSAGIESENLFSFENPTPVNPAGRIASVVIDYFDKVSNSDIREYNIDFTRPSAVVVNDGLGADEDITSSSEVLQANWTASSDPNSGITEYFYSIGTECGLTDVAGWTSSGTNTFADLTGLSLVNGETYYFSVYSENGAGLLSDTTCSDGITASFSITSAAFSATNEVCEGETISFENTSSNATGYYWEFEGGSPANSIDTEPTVEYTVPGTYSVSLVAFGSPNDTLIMEDYIVVYPAPVAMFTVNSTELTLPSAVATFTNMSVNADNYYWSFGDGNTSSDLSPYNIYTEEGTYQVMLVAGSSHCSSDTATIEISVIGTGLENDLESGSVVFPNPFTDKLYVEITGGENSNVSIEITDLEGRAVGVDKYYLSKTKNSGLFEITFSEILTNGVYILRTVSGEKVSNFRLVKM